MIGYLFDWYGYEDAQDNPNISLPKVMELLLLASASEEDEEHVSELDELFNMLEERRGQCFSVRQYKKFKQAAGKTMKSILISCSARLAPFDIPEVSELLSYDEVDIRSIGVEKTAFFMITSDTTSTFDFLGAMIFSLMFTKMFEQAYKDFGGRLPIHVRFMLDEFANMGVIPDADKKLSVMRSRNISASIVLQFISQLDKSQCYSSAARGEFYRAGCDAPEHGAAIQIPGRQWSDCSSCMSGQFVSQPGAEE